MSCSTIRESLAAYALGTLNVADRSDVGSHLAGCAVCRDILADFDGMPAILSLVAAADVESPATPSADLFARTLTAFRARRRRQRMVRVVALAAAVLVAAGIGTAVVTRDPSAPAARVVVAHDAISQVHAEVRFAYAAGGSNLWLTLGGVPRGERCQLVAIGADGRREVTATWQISYSGDAHIQGMTSWWPADLRSFEVVTLDGRRLVSIPVGSAARAGT